MSIKTFEAKAYGSAEEWAARTGTFVEEHEIDHIIDYDCDAYDAEGKPLFMFRKNVIPSSLCRSAYGALRSAATPTDNRGDAAGEFYVSDDKVLSVRQGVIDGDKKQKRFKNKTRDGYVSKQNRAKMVKSGIIGFFDRTLRFPYCRQTAWTEKNFGQFKEAYPYIKRISDEFKKACPERWEAQNKVVQDTHKDFTIGDTVFTTVTVNKNFRTALHYDADGYKNGLSNIAVMQAGKYEGGFTCMPRYRVGFDVRSNDVCFFNVHELHGNLPIKAKGPYERISIVCYYRENMMNCGSAEEELEVIKTRADLKGLNTGAEA